MSEKRKRDEGSHGQSMKSIKKAKHGFRVGPANLPDGTYKRHNDKIKKNLIEKAQIKKQYAKVKKDFAMQKSQKPIAHTMTAIADEPDKDAATLEGVSDDESEVQGDESTTAPLPTSDAIDHKSRRRRRRPDAFAKETQEAEYRRADANARREAREMALRERDEKRAERERFRKAMAKARTADGQRKLGRESQVLLEKVKRMVGVSQR